MSVTAWIREWTIYRTLKAISKQRVENVLQPENVWVIDKALPENEKTAANLRTCHLRGWVEPISNVIPKSRLTPEGNLPNDEILSRLGPLYRLTDSGWAAIYRTHELLLFSLFLALITLILTVMN